MSVVRTLLRLCAARALYGRTLAGEKVADSSIEPVDVAISEARVPMIVVTTDDDVSDITGRDVWEPSQRSLDLVIEVAVATGVEGGGFQIPETDWGFEWTLDIMEHQIDRALFNQGSPWSELFRRLIARVTRKSSRRGVNANNGIRFAARQIIYTVDTISTPVSGLPIGEGTPFSDALALMAADPELADFGAFLRTVVEGDMTPEWIAQVNQHGLALAEARAIRITPLDETETGEPAVAEQAVVTDEGDGLTVTVRAGRAAVTGSGDVNADATKE